VVRRALRGRDPGALGAAVGRALLEGGGAAIEGYGPDPSAGGVAP